MSIIRIKKEREYVSIANAILQDKSLSWEARGIMAYLLSKPDGWECRNYDLVNQGPAGKSIIQRVLKELQEAGYIYRYRKSDGHKIEWITEIYETPELNTTSRNTNILTSEKPTVGNSDVRESVHIVSTDSQKVLIPESTDSIENSQNPKTELNTLASKIAIITKTDIDTAGPKTREALKQLTIALSKKPNIEIKLPAYEKWWYANDWRGKQGQSPTVWHIGDTWGQFEADKVAPPPSGGPTLTEAERARLAELTAQFNPK